MQVVEKLMLNTLMIGSDMSKAIYKASFEILDVYVWSILIDLGAQSFIRQHDTDGLRELTQKWDAVLSK